MHKSGVADYKEFAQKAVTAIPDLPISFEVFSDDFDEMIAQALDVPPRIEVQPAKRVGEVTRYIADISRAVELLDYQPRVPLDEGIRRAVAWAAVWEAQHAHRP